MSSPDVAKVRRIRKLCLTIFLASFIPSIVLYLVVEGRPGAKPILPHQFLYVAAGLYLIAVSSVLVMAETVRKLGYPRGKLQLYQVVALTPLTVLAAAIFDRVLRDFIRQHERSSPK